MGSRDAGAAYGTKKNLILAGLEPAIFGSETNALSTRFTGPCMQKPRKDHTECGACRKIKTKEEKMTGGGFEPATLASAVGLLARRSLTRCRKCPEADGNALPHSRQSPCRDVPGSSPGEDISLGQSEEKKTCLHHCIISRNLQLDSL